MAGWVASVAPSLVAGAAGVGGAFVGAWGQRQNSADVARRTEESRTRALVDRYQEPLIRAAFDLQSRLYNILDDAFLNMRYGDAESGYGVNSTAWLFGQYFGWVEIVRREVQFLPSGDERQDVQAKLLDISRICASDRIEPSFRIFRADQRALGELMIIEGKDAEGRPRSDCMGYAAFVARLADEPSVIGPWFARLRSHVEELIREPGRPVRLEKLQHALIDFIELVDPEKRRFLRDRSRVSTAP